MIIIGDDQPNTIIFHAGMTDASFNVTLIDNNVYQEDHNTYCLIINSSVPNNVVLSDPRQATVIIRDDDCKY